MAETLGLSGFDFFILIIVLIFAITGLISGIIKQVFGVLAIILGFVFGTALLGTAVQIFNEFLQLTPVVSVILCFSILFLCIWLIVVAIGKFVVKVISMAFLRWVDRLLGASLGVFKGLLVASIAILILNFMPVTQEFLKGTRSSLLYDFTSKVAPRTYNGLQYLIPKAKPFYDELQGILTKNGKISEESKKFLKWLKEN